MISLILYPLVKGHSLYKISNTAILLFHLVDELIVAVDTVNGTDDEISTQKS